MFPVYLYLLLFLSSQASYIISAQTLTRRTELTLKIHFITIAFQTAPPPDLSWAEKEMGIDAFQGTGHILVYDRAKGEGDRDGIKARILS